MTDSRDRPERVLLPALVLLAACAGSGAGAGGDPGANADPGAASWVQVSTAPQGTGPVLTINGTVRLLEVEGGIYVIDDVSGTRYNPTNLPETFRTDGKEVEAEGRRRDDVASIGMVGPMLELVRIRERAGRDRDEAATPADGPDLAGSSWRLEDLSGAGVIDNARASLEFPDAGRVTGIATCNRFTGTVTVSGDGISFGPLATTRKACPEALMNQERKYLQALGAAQRVELKDGFLYLHSAGGGPPLRFVRE